MNKNHLNIFILFFISCLIISCENKKNPAERNVGRSSTFENIPVYHLKRDVMIPVSGYLQAWKKTEISLPDSALFISILHEQGTFVKKGDYIAGLWRLSGRGEYTPFDIISPFAGKISHFPFRVQSRTSPNQLLMVLENFEYLMLRAQLAFSQLRHIKAGNKVTAEYKANKLSGHVKNINHDKSLVNIIFNNPQNIYASEIFVRGVIHCRKVKGDFLPVKYFAGRSSLKVLLDDHIEINLHRTAEADSLCMVFPPLPDQQYIKIIKKSLDLTR